MSLRQLKLSALVACVALCATTASAAELFRDNLDDGVGWGFNSTDAADAFPTFGFNYGIPALSIPEAPNSQGGDLATTGILAQANIADPAGAEAFTAYPIGESFTGNYQLRFDAWMNIDLDAFYNNGAAGTTEFIGGGTGYDDTATDVGPGAQILATGEGGSGSDWRAFANGTFLATDDMVAGTRNGFDSHYSDFLPSQTPPAGQLQIYTGTEGGIAGSPGFQWVTFEIETNSAAGTAKVSIEKPGGERLHIATINRDGDAPFTNDGNVGLTYADFFSSVAAVPVLQFGLFDNVVVNSTPEPGSLMLLMAGLGVVATRRRR